MSSTAMTASQVGEWVSSQVSQPTQTRTIQIAISDEKLPTLNSLKARKRKTLRNS